MEMDGETPFSVVLGAIRIVVQPWRDSCGGALL